jgi:hypothetical protein
MAAMHEQTFECGGQFLSIEEWQAKGFDAEAIKTNTEANDKDWHPALGKTVYRVRLISKGERAEEAPLPVGTLVRCLFGCAEGRIGRVISTDGHGNYVIELADVTWPFLQTGHAPLKRNQLAMLEQNEELRQDERHPQSSAGRLQHGAGARAEMEHGSS